MLETLETRAELGPAASSGLIIAASCGTVRVLVRVALGRTGTRRYTTTARTSVVVAATAPPTPRATTGPVSDLAVALASTATAVTLGLARIILGVRPVA